MIARTQRLAAPMQMLRWGGQLALLTYVLWNAYWLARTTIPPSMFLWFTGLPAPTTGGIRAMIALRHGDLGESLRCNTMAIPILLLLGCSVAWLAARAVRRTRIVLPAAFLWLWIGFLAVAWVLKFCGSRTYW